jgi:hypothetical protein
VNVSCVEHSGVQELGEKAAETPGGSPDTEKEVVERLRDIVELALIVVVTDAPCVTVTGRPVLESDKPEVWVDVAAAVRTVSEEDKPTEVSELWLESAGIACR